MNIYMDIEIEYFQIQIYYHEEILPSNEEVTGWNFLQVLDTHTES